MRLEELIVLFKKQVESQTKIVQCLPPTAETSHPLHDFRKLCLSQIGFATAIFRQLLQFKGSAPHLKLQITSYCETYRLQRASVSEISEFVSTEHRRSLDFEDFDIDIDVDFDITIVENDVFQDKTESVASEQQYGNDADDDDSDDDDGLVISIGKRPSTSSSPSRNREPSFQDSHSLFASTKPHVAAKKIEQPGLDLLSQQTLNKHPSQVFCHSPLNEGMLVHREDTLRFQQSAKKYTLFQMTSQEIYKPAHKKMDKLASSTKKVVEESTYKLVVLNQQVEALRKQGIQLRTENVHLRGQLLSLTRDTVPMIYLKRIKEPTEPDELLPLLRNRISVFKENYELLLGENKQLKEMLAKHAIPEVKSSLGHS